MFLLISVILCNPVFLRIVQRSGILRDALELAQRQEELRTQYRMRATAAEGELLEQVLDFMDRDSADAKSASAAQLPASSLSAAELSGSSAANGGKVEEIEDVALRGMQDMRSVAYPDAGETANTNIPEGFFTSDRSSASVVTHVS